MKSTILILVFVFGAIAGCDQHPEVPAQPRAARTSVAQSSPAVGISHSNKIVTSHDFGEISLDEGAVRLEREFIVRNDLPQHASVSKVVTSCGCVKGEVASSELEPGEETTLVAAIEVKGVGATEHSATVVFSDGTETRYWLRAIGTRSTQFRIVPVRHRITDSSRSIRMTLQVVERARGRMEEGAPTARVGEKALPVICDKWVVVEARNELTGRPLRQSIDIEVDVSGYSGAFPAVVEIATPSGLIEEITVDSMG